TTPAASAATSITTNTAAPITTARFRRSRCRASAIADPWIDEDVEDVDDEIDEHVRGSGDEHDALHDGVVATKNGRDDQPAEARDVDDDLGDDGADDEHRGRDADDGDDR